jgi:hypothetical protein
MVLALPEAKTIQYTPQAAFCNIHGDVIATEQALEAAARVYMDSEYTTGGDRMEAIVTNLLIARWQRVHDDMIGDIAWIAIYRDDHKEYGECRPDLQMVDPDERSGPLEGAYRQLVLHLEIPGITALLDAQEGRSVRQAGIAIQSKLTEHIRSTDHQRSWRRAREYYRKDARRERMAAQLSDPREYVTEDTGRGGLDGKGMAYLGRIQTYQRIRTVILRDARLIDHDHREDEGEGDVEEEASDAASTAEQDGRSHQPDNQDHDNGSSHDAAPSGKAPTPGQWRRRQQRNRDREAKASNAGRGRMKTNEWGEPLEGPGPPVGETAAEMMGTMNRAIRHLRDQRREYLETTEGLHGGPCFKEDFQGNWSNVKYSRYVAADQDTYDWILRDHGADSPHRQRDPTGSSHDARPGRLGANPGPGAGSS